MPSFRSSAGDPARTLALLWRAGSGRGSRGPKAGLSVDAVISAAIEVANQDGLDRLSIRAVAGRLRVAPMSVYTYVPGKAELLDLMLDHAYTTMDRTEFGPSTPWRRRISAVADDNRALFTAHPWAAQVSTARPTLGPGSMAKYERELSAFDGLGLDDVTVDNALTWILSFVQANARAAVDKRVSELDSAMNDEEWWAANAPLLERVFDGNAYPRAARIGAAAGKAHGSAYNPDHAYQFGLARILDALARLVDSAR